MSMLIEWQKEKETKETKTKVRKENEVDKVMNSFAIPMYRVVLVGDPSGLNIYPRDFAVLLYNECANLSVPTNRKSYSVLCTKLKDNNNN